MSYIPGGATRRRIHQSFFEEGCPSDWMTLRPRQQRHKRVRCYRRGQEGCNRVGTVGGSKNQNAPFHLEQGRNPIIPGVLADLTSPSGKRVKNVLQCLNRRSSTNQLGRSLREIRDKWDGASLEKGWPASSLSCGWNAESRRREGRRPKGSSGN